MFDEKGQIIIDKEEVEMDADEMFADSDWSGKYLIKDGKLYMTTDEDSDPAEEDGTEYKVSEKSLTIQTPQNGDEETPDFLKELTFTRIG